MAQQGICLACNYFHRNVFLKLLNLNLFFLFTFSVLGKIVVNGYKVLQLQYFFTAGPDEVKAWTIQVHQFRLFLLFAYQLCMHVWNLFLYIIIIIFDLQKGSKAPQAAGRIHTDFEKGFIMAEVMKFSDFKEEGSESACKVKIFFYFIFFT